MAELTLDERDDIISLLTINCGGCPDGGGDREALEQVSDDMLLELAANAIPAGVEKAQKGKKPMSAQQQNPEGEDQEKMDGEQTPATNSNLTEEQWLAQQPEFVRNSYRQVKKIQDQERNRLVSGIVANMGEDQKKTILPRLNAMDLDQLADFAKVFSGSSPAVNLQNQATPLALYMGADSPATNAGKDYDRSTFLPIPVINYNEKKA